MECIGCTERITHLALLECGHSSACPLCILRLRSLLHDNRCPECRHPSEVVFIADSGTYEDHSSGFWGDRHMHGFKEFEQTKIYCETEDMHQEFVTLVQPGCQLCGVILKSRSQLLTHLESEHRLHMCDLCLANKTVFVSEQELYTVEDLREHKEGGDGESPGHPRCRLCSRFVYDDKALLQHIREQHYFCDLCPVESRPAFINYESLEKHYDKSHFLCAITSCKRAKHVVFATWDELIGHHRTYHRGCEMPVLKPSFLGSGEEYIPRASEAPVKQAGVPLTEERKNEEFPALCSVTRATNSAWGESDNPLKQLVLQKQRSKRSTPQVLVNPLTFKPVKAKPEEVKANWGTAVSPPVQPPPKQPAAAAPTKPSRLILTTQDFPSLSTQEAQAVGKTEVTVESQVVLLNRKQVGKEAFIDWFAENVRKDKAREQYTTIYDGLSDRRLAEAVVAGIEGRFGSGKTLWDSDFPALGPSAAPAKAKKQREKKQKQGAISLSAWTAQQAAPREAVSMPMTDFPALPAKPETEDFPGLPVTAPPPKPTSQGKKHTEEVKEEPPFYSTIRDNLALLASGTISHEEFVSAYIQIVPHAHQLSSGLLAILKSAGAQTVINDLWARVDKSTPARTVVLDKYKEELDRLLHMYRYGFITKEKFVEDYSALVEQRYWVDREIVRYISLSVPGEALIEAIEIKNRESSSYTESQFPGFQTAKSRRKAK